MAWRFSPGLKETNPGVDVIFISGYGLEGEIQSLLELGVRGFIGQPFRLEQLSKSMEDIIGPKNGHVEEVGYGGSFLTCSATP